MATATKLLTAREYALLPDDGAPTELVRGEIVEMASPYPRHGQICSHIAYMLRRFQEDQPIGHVVTNDAGVITERNPDTVRGPDVAFYSFGRVPPGPFPRDQYLTSMPELVFEVRSPSDRWREMIAKVNEYLQAGVAVVCVVDENTQEVQVFDDDGVRVLGAQDELSFPKLLTGLQIVVRRLFD
jgi:Uma2 family endonuclease